MDADDLLSEISTPDINHSERSKIMDIVNGRDRQEQELQACFNNLLSKADGVDSQDIEQVANQSAKEFRESGKMNIFKPQLTGMTPRKQESALKPVKPTHNMHAAQPRKKVQAWADRPGSSALNKSQPLAIQDANPAGSRLDAIYAQLRDL